MPVSTRDLVSRPERNGEAQNAAGFLRSSAPYWVQYLFAVVAIRISMLGVLKTLSPKPYVGSRS